LKHTVEIDAVDIPTMYKMTEDDYRKYIDSKMLFVDHHDVLRSGFGEYPLAVTKAQLLMLIEHLKGLEDTVGAEIASREP